jgi:hypothetical protein
VRQCPFNGCDVRIDPSLFACPPHWRSLDAAARQEVYAAYRAWQSGGIDGAELRRRQQAVLDGTATGGRAE